MEENNNQGFQGQNQGQPVNQNPNQNQAEHTYWENSNMAQPNPVPPQNMQNNQSMPNQYPQGQSMPNYQNVQNPYPQGQNTPNYQNMQNPQNSQYPDNASQFYQYYQQQMGSGNNYNQPQPGMGPMQPGVVPIQQKKKSHKGLIAVIIVLVLVLAGGGTAFAFRDTLANTFAMMTKSPDEYYAYIEKKSIEEKINEITPYLNTTKKDGAYQMSMDVSYDRETVNSLLQSSAGITLDDLDASIGIPLNSIGVNGIVATQDGNIYESLGLKLNSTDIISLEFLLDAINKQLLVRFPELSSAALRQTTDLDEMDVSKYTEQLKLLTPERTADFLKRYCNIVAENMKDVELTKNEKLELDELSVTCNKLTVTIDNESAYDIISAVLQEAEDDEYIYDLLPLFNTSKSDYRDYMKEAQSSLKDEIENGSTGFIEMAIYVNDKGEIIGRDITSKEDGNSLGTFGYTDLAKNDYREYNLHFIDENGDMVVDATGNETKTGDTSDGELNIAIKDPTYTLPSDINVNVKYEGVKTVKKDGQNYLYGTYTIASPQTFGVQLVIENSVENDEQLCKLSVQMGSSSLVTVNAKSKYLEDYDIPDISASELYDFADYESYLATIDIDGFIANLSDKLGVDLGWLQDYLFGYTY